MPHYFEGLTADDVWRSAAKMLLGISQESAQSSRLGLVREALQACFYIEKPRQRWVFSRQPAINPAFAIAEVVWILCGRNDADFLNYWNPILPKYAGSSQIYHGAYGHRLRKNYGIDQLEQAYQALRTNPESRQVVLQLWDSSIDLPKDDGKPLAPDIPCNVCSMLSVRDGRLEWTQVMRSNDLFLGAPHNFIQFTSMQEIFAGWLGLELGSYTQISNSLHIYEHDLDKYGISTNQISDNNTDDIALPKGESDRALAKLEMAMDILRQPGLQREQFYRLLGDNDLSSGYQNMLAVVSADSARRRGWESEMLFAENKIANPALSLAWTRWSDRMNS
ncbi:MAG: thymidylate synthase [Candidatus Thiodiazotropha endolucinida]